MTPTPVGQRFGLLVVLGEGPRPLFPDAKGKRARMWRCACDCGTVKDIRAGNLKRGYGSCGCRRGRPRRTPL